MEAEEITKLVDGVYKNILEKFNPGARQLITAGKAYLKALHGAASASRLFNEALVRISMNAQQSGTGDIGTALMSVVSVYKDIQDQQMNILKAFYVDLLVPLETNLEKDTKVVQHEQKKFLQQHKVRMESYQKAISTMKKHRKKKNSPENTEKELKTIQLLDDQKKKLDQFCEQSYKNAMTQERRRYGFVLERQCSIAKHWMAYYTNGKATIENNLDSWQEVASSREVLPTVCENNFLKRMEKVKEDESNSGSSMLKKARSVDAPYGDMRTLNESNYMQNSLPRAKSDFNLAASGSISENWDQRPVAKALYAYMPSGENQLPFAEGDRIALVGNKAKGWQFGENLRTQMFGWFPIAYTNAEGNEKKTVTDRERENNYENVIFERNGVRSYHEFLSNKTDTGGESDSLYRRRNNSAEESSPTRMFGDTIMFRNQKKHRGVTGVNPKPGPPPSLPAPVPSASNVSRMLNSSQSFCLPNGPPIIERRKHKHQNGPPPTQKHMREGTAKTSLHSSNDSGFANEPPPQPEVDYSDEEHSNRVPIRRRTDASNQSSREINSWTLSRNFKSNSNYSRKLSTTPKKDNMKQSSSFENIIASDDEILHGGEIKRTKSFWRFGKSDEILAGMSLWRHRDLVQLQQSQDNNKSMKNQMIDAENSSSSTVTTVKPSSRNSMHKSEQVLVQRKESSSTMENFEEENIYGSAQLKEEIVSTKYHQQQEQQKHMIQNYKEKQVPKSRTKIIKTIEIDIASLPENERTKKIQSKDYRENLEYNDYESHQKKIYQAGTSTSASSEKMRNKVNNKINNSKQQIEQKGSKHQKIVNKRKQSSSDSDEDDNDDDDNDTLKMSDINNFFDDISPQESGVLMKTVKRQDILKQYYTSEEEEESDVEIKSTSSDPYDCIVINDHLVHKDEKNRRHLNAYHEQMDFQTFRSVPKNSNGNNSNNGNTLNNTHSIDKLSRNEDVYSTDSKTVSHTATILPRTKLVKSSNLTLEKNLKKNKDNNANLNAEKAKSFAKTYGPWYDFWDHQDQQPDEPGQN